MGLAWQATGAAFHALGEHAAELWVARRFLSDKPVVDALDTIVGERFQRLLAGIGGYDLSGSGSQAA